MAACSALVKYMEYGKSVMFAQCSLKITYEALEDSCLIGIFYCLTSIYREY